MNNDFLTELIRSIVAKIPAKWYLVIGTVLALAEWFIIHAIDFNIVLPVWVKELSPAVVFLLFFFRPQSSSDAAVDTAAKLKLEGNTSTAHTIVQERVNEKAAKLKKAA